MNRHFTKEDIKMAKKDVKSCSTLLTIRKCKQKTQWDIIMHVSKWLT